MPTEPPSSAEQKLTAKDYRRAHPDRWALNLAANFRSTSPTRITIGMREALVRAVVDLADAYRELADGTGCRCELQLNAERTKDRARLTTEIRDVEAILQHMKHVLEEPIDRKVPALAEVFELRDAGT